MLKSLMIDLMHSWMNSDDTQVKHWEEGASWPEMDAIIREIWKIRSRDDKTRARINDRPSTEGGT